jgi:predicted nucleic acid-binding protein
VRISPDPDDVEYIAVALSIGCVIWSNDKDLKEKQSEVKVFSTADLVSFLA